LLQTFIIKANFTEHLAGSGGEKYCCAQLEKYPEVID